MTQPAPDPFLSACGAAGPVELLVSGPGAEEPRRYSSPQPFVRIGSDPACDLHLDHPEVSRRHAYLQLLEGRPWCLDLSSRQGVHWPDGPRRAGWVEPGQPLRIGPFELRWTQPVSANRTDWDPTTSSSSPPRPLVGASLELVRGQLRSGGLRLPRALTLVGSAPVCKLRLNDATVSRCHCALLRTPAGVWVIDLLGRGGTWVDGERVACARLEEGARLQIGDFLIRVRLDGDRAALPAARPAVELLPVRVPPNGPGPEGPLLTPVINQFNLLQQQMFDQFHQTMLMMVQMFGALHRDQMGLVREELDHLHGLTQELQELQTELRKHPAPEPAAAPAPEPAPATPPPAPAPTRLPEARAANGQGEAEIHARLSERIAALQAERQSRWQKVMQFVLGK